MKMLHICSARHYRVYTKTGDKGTSSLYNGERREKDDELFEALGDVDELNANIGLAREHCLLLDVGIEEALVELQSRLMDVGTAIATPLGSSTPSQLERAAFPAHVTQNVEKWIDAMDAQLPTLKNFILPSGGLASAQLHVARTVCRRAERRCVRLVKDGHLQPDVAVFMNRLSDYLFVAARYAASKAKAEEEIYKKAVGLTHRPLAAPTATAAAAVAAAASGDAGSGSSS